MTGQKGPKMTGQKGSNMTRPFRFSIQAFSSPTRKEWVELAQKV